MGVRDRKWDILVMSGIFEKAETFDPLYYFYNMKISMSFFFFLFGGDF